MIIQDMIICIPSGENTVAGQKLCYVAIIVGIGGLKHSPDWTIGS